MEELIIKVTESLKNFYSDLDTSRKVGLVAVTMVILSTMIAMIFWASQTTYKKLYSDLNEDDLNTITRMLEDEKIAYRIVDDNKSILIPEDRVESFRLKMATKGMAITGTLGYEIFDKQSFGTTNFVQKINKKRALEGELIKTIKHLRGVKRARVHLSIPEESPFIKDKKPPTASVVLDLDKGVVLTPREIRGVAQLVSSSVNGMRDHNVVIIDSRGKKLSENIGDELTQNTSNRLALEAKHNSELERKIEEILSSVVGHGKVIAKVKVEMDFTERIATETNYNQENAAVLSQVTNEEKLQGSRPSPQGIPGARSNLPGETPQPGIPETRNDVNKTLKTTNNLVPSTVIKSRNPVAVIKNVSAAVMIDGKYETLKDKDGNVLKDELGVPKQKYVEWSKEQLDQFTEIVASSIGIDGTRGDKLTIRSMEFAKEDLAAIEAIMRDREKREVIKNLVKYLAIGLAMCLFFFFVVRPFVHWVTENTIESVEDFLPKTIEELEKVQANQKLPGLEEALPQIEETLNPEKIEGNMLKEKIISLCENNPSKAAQIIHEWIHNSESDKQIA